MNTLKDWVRSSRKEQQRNPGRYLGSYSDLYMDETHVLMTKEQLETIKQKCGRYDGTFPTGEYLGKMFLRGDSLWWFSISKENPLTHTALQSRTIQLVDEEVDE